ncbi:MAG: hypothetical protein JSW47_11850, partial [Phycisphaerales bacterium]
GRTDRRETVPMPIMNFLDLLAGMGESYLVLPERTVGGHVVSGFASKADQAVKILLYSHHGHDIQSRSQVAFETELDLSAVPWPQVRVREYRFDKDNNSYYRLALDLRDGPASGPNLHRPSPNEIHRLIADLASGDRAVQIAAIKKVASLRDIPEEVVGVALKLYEQTEHKDVRTAIEEAGRQIQVHQRCYSPEDMVRVRELSVLRVTNESTHSVGADGTLRLRIAIAANGANFVKIEPAEDPL